MMKTIRLLTACVVTLGLACFTGCGESEPTPSQSPRPKKAAKTDGGAKTTDGGTKPKASEGWGHLKVRFALKGDLPELPKVAVTKDVEYCGKQDVKNETVVKGDGDALQNVVVYLRTADVNIHDDYKKSEKATVTLDNHKCRFEPHVCLLRTTQKLKIGNSDPMPHNTKFDSPTQGFNVLIPANSNTEKDDLNTEERVPIPVGCNVHPWMRGYLLVRENPYMQVSGKDGVVEIKHLPAGELEFQAWHEQQPQGLAVGNFDDRGRFKVTIEPGEKTTDLGTIGVPVSLVAKP
jgi:hypothetical protein